LIAITFDDGPCSQTPEILELLDQYKVTASFFVIGKKAKELPELVKLITEKNHTLGNHSYHHANWFPVMLPDQIRAEIASTQQLLKKITGREPLYWRPPFGVTNPLIAKALIGYSLKTIGWSIRSLDTVSDNPEKTINRIKKRIKPGSILLLHDTSKNVTPVLKELLVYCAKNNLKPVSLDEFLKPNSSIA
jgi:peptidoglycan-N-acetylglucosamine deacetylase